MHVACGMCSWSTASQQILNMVQQVQGVVKHISHNTPLSCSISLRDLWINLLVTGVAAMLTTVDLGPNQTSCSTPASTHHTQSEDIKRGPKTHPNPEIPTKTPRLCELFRKACVNFCLLPCDTNQEPKRNCSEELVQMNFCYFAGFLGLGISFPPLKN